MVSIFFQTFTETTIAVSDIFILTFFFLFLVASAIIISREEKNHPRYISGITRLQTIKSFSSADRPWFCVRNYRKVLSETGCKVFRIKLLPWECNIIVNDAELLRKILNDRATNKSPRLKFFEKVTNGPNLLSAKGIRWKHARRGIAPALHREQIKRVDEVGGEKVDQWIKRTLEPASKSGKSIDICHEMMRLILSIFFESMLEYQVDDDYLDFFLGEMEVSLKTHLLAKPLQRLFGSLNKNTRRARLATKNLSKMALKIIDHYRNKKEKKRVNSIIRLVVDNHNYVDDNERASDIIMLIIGGYDTSAYGVAFLMLEIARKHTKVCPIPELEAFRKEIQNSPKDEWKYSTSLQYMIRESLRLNPPAPIASIYITGRDYEYSYGEDQKVVIPKGCNIFTPIISIHRDPDVYEFPDEFKPSRWNKELVDKETLRKQNLAFIPFSYGPRNCYGRDLAMREMNIIVSRLLGQYDFIVEDEGRVDYFLTLKPMDSKLIPIKLK